MYSGGRGFEACSQLCFRLLFGAGSRKLKGQTHAACLDAAGFRGRIAAQGLLVLGGLREQDGIGDCPGPNTQNQEAFLLSGKRTFTVRVNIDDMTAMLAGLDGQSEKADWLDGYMVGVHGHQSRESWSSAKMCGFEFGSLHAREVEAYREEQSTRGQRSAAVRAAKSGSAQPRRTGFEPPFEPPFEPDVEPASNQSNNPTIQQSIKPKIQRSKVFTPPTIEEATEYAASVGFHGVAQWFAYYETNGWKVGKNKMTDWKAAIRYWKSKDGAAFAAPTLDEWMQAGEQIAMSNPTHARQRWPRDLCRSAYHGAAANGWRGVTDWRGKILAECLRWVGNENGRART